MDDLDKLTAHAANLSKDARKAYVLGHPPEALEHLEKLWDLLWNQFACNAPRLCESDESSSV